MRKNLRVGFVFGANPPKGGGAGKGVMGSRGGVTRELCLFEAWQLGEFLATRGVSYFQRKMAIKISRAFGAVLGKKGKFTVNLNR